jgi:hypothetical protein
VQGQHRRDRFIIKRHTACCCLSLQDYIQRLMAEKADLDKRFHGMKDELITRLQNACAQRDEARAQVGSSLCCVASLPCDTVPYMPLSACCMIVLACFIYVNPCRRDLY